MITLLTKQTSNNYRLIIKELNFTTNYIIEYRKGNFLNKQFAFFAILPTIVDYPF